MKKKYHVEEIKEGGDFEAEFFNRFYDSMLFKKPLT